MSSLWPAAGRNNNNNNNESKTEQPPTDLIMMWAQRKCHLKQRYDSASSTKKICQDWSQSNLRGGVIDGSKSAHGQTAAHGRHFCPANFPAKKVPMGSAQQTEFMSLK
jgi:hypothetical protein